MCVCVCLSQDKKKQMRDIYIQPCCVYANIHNLFLVPGRGVRPLTEHVPEAETYERKRNDGSRDRH
jgi:hypothetical protein